jgi:hypothetical protein
MKLRLIKKSKEEVKFKNDLWDEVGKGTRVSPSNKTVKKEIEDFLKKDGEIKKYTALIKKILDTGFVPNDEFFLSFNDEQLASLIIVFLKNNFIPSDKALISCFQQNTYETVYKVFSEWWRKIYIDDENDISEDVIFTYFWFTR